MASRAAPDDRGTLRTEAFSDAVFAIAITGSRADGLPAQSVASAASPAGVA